MNADGRRTAAVSRLPPIVPALLLQALAIAGTVLALRLSAAPVPLWGMALLSGAVAALLSHFAGLERWWLVIQLLAAPAGGLLLSFPLHPSVYLAVFVALLLVYWSTFRTRVPLYLSGPRVWQAVLALLPPPRPGAPLRVIDLGSGLGGLLLFLGQARGDARLCGVELAPLPMLVSRVRIALRGQRNCTVHWGSYWPVNLRDYDVVFAFLSPVPMGDLWLKACREMRAGSLFISSSFEVPGQVATRIVTVDDARATRLHVWTMAP